ncbi:hypothetical protein D9M70_618250 [compost metagenome]
MLVEVAYGRWNHGFRPMAQDIGAGFLPGVGACQHGNDQGRLGSVLLQADGMERPEQSRVPDHLE